MAPPVVVLTAFFIATAAGPVVPHHHCDRPAAEPSHACVGAPSNPAAIQVPQPPVTWLDRLRRYVTAVERHQPGTPDEHLRLVASWSEAETEAVVGDIAALADRLTAAASQVARSGGRPVFSLRGRTFSLQEVGDVLALSEDEARHGNCNRLLEWAALLHTESSTSSASGTS
jgi:hypothetical protein